MHGEIFTKEKFYFTKSFFTHMSEPRTPKKIKDRLEKYSKHHLEIDYHVFRGMKNYSSFCYTISVLQLFFHCTDFIDYISNETLTNHTEKLLKEIYDLLYSQNTKAVDISNFTNGWTGWGNRNAGFPPGHQDVQEFFIYFMNGLSEKLLDLFSFQANERSERADNFVNLRVSINGSSLRECIINEINTNVKPLSYPQNLFIQLDRAMNTQMMSSKYVTINNTIIFGDKFYEFVGVIVYIDNHYHSIIKIENEFFDFNDSDVNPLFLDECSVFPSSYNRIMECEKLIHRNSVLFLYKMASDDDSSIVHLSPKMRKIMENKTCASNVLHFSKDNDGETTKFIEIPNNELLRNVINLTDFPNNDLNGTMKINHHGIPEKVINPIAPNRYMKIRNIFKLVSRVLRKMKEYDTGKLNAMLLKSKLEIFEEEEMDFVNTQGFLLYDIIVNDLLEKDNITINDVENSLQVIIDSYEAKYGNIIQQTRNVEPIFTNSYNEESTIQEEEDDYEILKKVETSVEDDEIINKVETNSEEDETINKVEKSSEDEESFFLYKYDETTEDNEIDSDTNDTEKMPDQMIQSLIKASEKISSSDDFDWTHECSDDYDYYYDDDYEDDKNGSNIFKPNSTIKIWSQHSDYEIQSSPVSVPMTSEETTDISDDDDDDNQFRLKDYDWKSRVKVLDAEKILSEIRNKIHPKKDYDSPLLLKSDIKEAIQYEVIRARYNNPQNRRKKIKDFAKEWIENNIKGPSKHVLVMSYNKILEEEAKRKKKAEEKRKRKRGEIDNNDEEETGNQNQIKEYKLSPNTIKHWIEHFETKDNQSKKEYLERAIEKGQRICGGCRNLKMTDDAILCLMCMALDFPNMQVKYFTSYLNSKYGPCSEKNVKDSTVFSAMRALKFSIKKAAFCPPARNSIGLRIFRVAWSLFMDEISNQKDVLIGFIDEAAITIAEGSKFGRAFVGITPLINSPLSNCVISVLACVVPAFGVLYKFFPSAVHGNDYATFLDDIINFFRIYVCSSNAQIVLIEDNCKIHCTQEVENTISKLNVALIPTVQYSPALNGVAEGYFGYVKLRHIDFSEQDMEDLFDCDEQKIQEKWSFISDNEFTNKISKKLYCEWKARMAQCVQGIPLVSGHIKIDRFEKDAKRLTTVPVFRNHKETSYKL